MPWCYGSLERWCYSQCYTAFCSCLWEVGDVVGTCCFVVGCSIFCRGSNRLLAVEMIPAVKPRHTGHKQTTKLWAYVGKKSLQHLCYRSKMMGNVVQGRKGYLSSVHGKGLLKKKHFSLKGVITKAPIPSPSIFSQWGVGDYEWWTVCAKLVWEPCLAHSGILP